MSNWWKKAMPWRVRINASGVGWYLARWRWWRGLSPADRYLVDARVSERWCREYDRVKVRS